MPHDPERVAEVRAWLVKSLHDLQAAETLLKEEHQLTDIAGFHCQQAAEKALKAFLTWHDLPFRKTHELERLSQDCISIDASLGDLLSRAVELTPFAWRFRYPGEPQEPSLEDARQALELAKEVHNEILSRLPGEVKP